MNSELNTNTVNETENNELVEEVVEETLVETSSEVEAVEEEYKGEPITISVLDSNEEVIFEQCFDNKIDALQGVLNLYSNGLIDAVALFEFVIDLADGVKNDFESR